MNNGRLALKHEAQQKTDGLAGEENDRDSPLR